MAATFRRVASENRTDVPHSIQMKADRLARWASLAVAVLVPGACSDGSPTGDDPDGFNLRIEAAYVVQATQRLNGTVPLIADRDAYVRVFAVASQPNTADPSVRVRLLNGGSEVATYELPAKSPAVPGTVDQANLNTSWNVRVPGELIQPGLAMLIQADPDDRIAESSEDDNTFPADGRAQALTVHEMPPLRLTLVPIHQSVNGRTGDLTAANVERYLSFARKVHPIAELQVELREPFTTSLPAVDPEGNVWERVLVELEALRLAESGDPGYYFGIVNTAYAGGGVIGIANGIPSRTSLGWDRFPDASQTLAHELGHNFGRRHVSCGNPAGVDVNYPYGMESVGVFGMDVSTGEVKHPSGHTDFMSYCEDQTWWVSDYTYRGVLAYRLENDLPAAATARGSLLVWGRIDEEGIVLEPAFQLDLPGSAPASRGNYRVEGMGSDGSTLFSYTFAPAEINDGRGGPRSFALRLPVDAATADRLATLTVSGEGRRASISSVADVGAGRGLVLPEARSPIRRLDAGTVELSWDADAHPMVMVRDAATGRVLSFARGGHARVAASTPDVELSYSDGVRSVSTRVAVGR